MGKKASVTSSFSDIDPLDPESGEVNTIIDTPKGSRNKYKFDEQHGLFKLASVMPAGSVFPFNFGYVPSTLGADGDPVDVLVLMDEATFVGCLVPSRLIGVIEAEQTEKDGKTVRNDRLIAVAADSHEYQRIKSLGQVDENLMDEIEHYFVSYNEIRGKQFKPLGRHGPQKAAAALEEGIRLYRKQRGRKKAVKSKAGKKKR
ncbi:MAG TPA: inorganic diphosphatase [Blastocatellia bacterium]|nr:inorganic diphosphatase [Blastocatellia bacterium]